MRCFLIFLSSLLAVLVVIPPIILVTQKSRMLDEPLESRKVHKLNVPNSGGIGIFIGFLFSCLVFISFDLLPQANVLMAAAMIVFIMGLKDDIDSLAPYKKFVAQFVAAVMVCVFADIRIPSLYGFLGVFELSHNVSIGLTLFAFVGIVNAFNLIDGIDGLAASLGILISLLFTFLYFEIGQLGYAYLSIALTGALIGFLRFNITPARIFMGDSGSLLLGFIIAIIAIRITDIELMDQLKLGPLQITSGVALVLSILVIPVFDTLRVFSIRIYNRKSPFAADSNHLHHRLLFLGLSHIKACITLILVNIFIIGTALALQGVGNTALVLLISAITLMLNSILSLLVERQKSLPKGISL